MPYKLRIHHMDVGQGDSTLIVLKNNNAIEKAILIDAGSGKMTGKRVYNYCLRKLRSKEGRVAEKKIDTIIMSHFDSDHINGLPTIINSDLVDGDTKYFSPIRARSKNNGSGYDNVLEAIKQKYDLINLDAAKDKIQEIDPRYEENVEQLKIYCLAANMLVDGEKIEEIHGSKKSRAAGYSGSRANQISLAFVFTIGNFLYYTGGDIGQAQEKAIAEYLKNLRLSAFKISHHGSHSSTPAELLEVLNDPSVGIISYGHNSHKHPHSEVLQRTLVTEKLKRLYLTGQLNRYNIPLVAEGEEIPAPGNIVLRQSPEGFTVSYDRFDKEERRREDDSIPDSTIPENAFYEIILSFENLNDEDKALRLSISIANDYKGCDAMGEYDWQTHFNEIFRARRGEDIAKMTEMCQLRYEKIHAVTTFERKTRRALDGGGRYINKMTDSFSDPEAGPDITQQPPEKKPRKQ